jgi:hypothetical protein
MFVESIVGGRVPPLPVLPALMTKLIGYGVDASIVFYWYNVSNATSYYNSRGSVRFRSSAPILGSPRPSHTLRLRLSSVR